MGVSKVWMVRLWDKLFSHCLPASLSRFFRQRDRELGALACLRFNIYGAFMGFHRSFTVCESEAPACGFGGVERLEEVSQLGFLDAYPRVGHLDFNFMLIFPGARALYIGFI